MVRLQIKTIEEFLERARTKRVYIYGAGNYIKSFCTRYGDAFAETVSYVIDSNLDKGGNEICLSGKTHTIISPDIFGEMVKEQDIVVITSLDYISILHFLDEMEELDGIECHILAFMEKSSLHTFVDKDLMERNRAESEVIPRIIHYCWFGDGMLTDMEKRCIESWHKYCPDYMIKCWDESNYDVSKNRYMYDAYKAKKWGFVPDYARLDIISHYGGIYLDTDVELMKPLDGFLCYPGYMGMTRDGLPALGLGYGAAPGNKLLSEMLKNYESVEFLNMEGKPNLTPAPYYHLEWMKSYGFQRFNKVQMIEDVLVLPSVFFDILNYYNGNMEITEYAVSAHLYNGSWNVKTTGIGLEERKNHYEALKQRAEAI